MFFGMRIEPGAVVEADDGHFGVVDEVILQPETGELAYLLVRHDGDRVRVPASMIDSVTDPHEVRLGLTTTEARARLYERVATADDAAQVRIPIHEERLTAAVEEVGLGEVRIHKRVEHVEETVEQPVRRDDLDIERVPIHRPLDAPAVPRHEDGWFVVPIMEEVLVVQKRLMLVEEVRIRARQVTEIAQVRETVRRERVSLEDATVYGVNSDVPGLRRRRARPEQIAEDTDGPLPPHDPH